MLIPLLRRSVLCVEGEDAIPFLQGLLTQDMRPLHKLLPHALYSAALNAQGRLLGDMIMIPWKQALWLDIDASLAEALKQHLIRYRLRQRVQISAYDASSYPLYALPHENPSWPQDLGGLHAWGEHGVLYRDPRYGPLGYRLLGTPDVLDLEGLKDHSLGEEEEYLAWRLQHGIPEPCDWDVERSTPLEVGLGDLNAFSWTKGCYLGQELTSRTHYQGVLRKRLWPVSFDQRDVPSKEPVLLEGVDVGHIRSTQGHHGLAWLRVEAVKEVWHHGKILTAGPACITPHRAEWMRLPPGT